MSTLCGFHFPFEDLLIHTSGWNLRHDEMLYSIPVFAKRYLLRLLFFLLRNQSLEFSTILRMIPYTGMYRYDLHTWITNRSVVAAATNDTSACGWISQLIFVIRQTSHTAAGAFQSLTASDSIDPF